MLTIDMIGLGTDIDEGQVGRETFLGPVFLPCARSHPSIMTRWKGTTRSNRNRINKP